MLTPLICFHAEVDCDCSYWGWLALKIYSIATKNVNGKDTLITWLTCRRFRVWFSVRSLLFGLFSSSLIRLFSSIQTHSSVSTWPIRVYACLLPHLSPLMNSPLVRGWLHLPTLHAGSQQMFTHWSCCIFSLEMWPFTPPPHPPGAGVWDGEEYCHISFPSWRVWVWDKALLAHLNLQSKGDGDSPFPPKEQNR